MRKKHGANADRPKKLGINISIATGFDESSTMAYLRGEVVDGEHEAACDYEFARESRVICEAARLHRQGLSFEEVGEQIDQVFGCGGLFLASRWFEFFTCAHFPETPWNSLSAEDRREILRTLPLPYGSGQQLLMQDLRRLERVLNALKEKAAKARAKQTGEKVLPVWHKGQITYPLLVLDAGKTRKQHVDAFDVWLELPEMKERPRLYRKNPSGKTGTAKDRLKDLAVWRLFEHCKGNWVKANLFAQKHKESACAGANKPFHGARQGKEKDYQKSEALLYSENSGFSDAIKRAQDHLRHRMPWEFFKEAEQAKLYKIQTRIEKKFVAAGGVCKEPLKEARDVPLGRLDVAKDSVNEFRRFLARKRKEMEESRLSREARFRAFDPAI